MSSRAETQRTGTESRKENKRMLTRRSILTALLSATIVLFVLMPVASASAAQPWWQVLTGSRPSNMWEAAPKEVQEVRSEAPEGLLVAPVKAAGKTVGCLGVGFGSFLCPRIAPGVPVIETAAQFQEALEPVYGSGKVTVTGGPAGSAPFTVTTGWGPPLIEVSALIGSAGSEVVSKDSGRLVVTLTNLGDETIDGTSSPVRIVDKLPQGVIAYGVQVGSPRHGREGVATCNVQAANEVLCTYEGRVTPYESIEVEVLTALTGSPPVAGMPGEVSVSGGNAPPESAPQSIKVSDQPVRFGAEQFSAAAEEEGGTPVTQAGSHPFQFTTTLQLNAGRAYHTRQPLAQGSRGVAIEQPALPRNLRFPLPAGLVGNATAVPQCPMKIFLHVVNFINECPDATVVGLSSVTVVERVTFGLFRFAVPVFNLPPAHGEPARFGFMAAGDQVIIDTSVDPQDGYRITAEVSNITQLVEFLSSTTTFWGTPSDPRHDNARGWNCVYFDKLAAPGPCARPSNLSESAFLRMPVQCSSPLDFGLEAEHWNVPIRSQIDSASVTGDPLSGCNRVPFDPTIAASPTSRLAENPSGLSFDLTMPNSGLLNPGGIAESQPKKVEVTLPEGMTVNPSEAEGLAACTPADYARETVSSKPGEGCPEASKIGNVHIVTPLLEEEAQGALYLAEPHENPFNSLLAIYLVARFPDSGVIIKLAGRIDPDPVTGQLLTTFDNLPALPFTSFKLQFREGARAPLVTPPTCGSYQTVARFVPWSAEDPSSPAPGEVVERSSVFTIEHGVDGGSCPAGGTPPFAPQLVAGTQNNAGGSYSPFYMRILRRDGEQEITKFSTIMPPGLTGNLTGIPFCPEAAIQAARERSSLPNGGALELADPSCPAASQIGRSLVGAGVGSVLAYTPGKIYLAGPYHGSALSIVSVTSATVGPFDLGTVVIRFALRINPLTAQVEVDSTGSDPIPHIIQGIVVHVRDIRVYIDRSKFMLNPTSCAPMSFQATVTGSGANFASTTDDQPVTVDEPFQAADCQALKFKPSFKAFTSGKTSRRNGASLTVKLTYPKTPLGTQTNIRKVRVELPKQLPSRLSTLQKACPDTVFEHDPASCPAESRVGYAKANTPILPVPLEGPAYFVSHGGAKWPELILVLQGYGITIDLHGQTFINKGITSSTFSTVPDQPVSSFTLTLPQGPGSALAAPQNLCTITRTVLVKHKTRTHKTRKTRKTIPGSLTMPTTFTAQNGLVTHQNTKIAITGCDKHKGRHKGKRHRGRKRIKKK